MVSGGYGEKSRKEYYKNPNYCLECKKIMHVRIGQRTGNVKRNKFCNRQCSAAYVNKFSEKRRVPVQLELQFPKPKPSEISEVAKYTKKEFYNYRKNWQSANSGIRKHSRAVYRDSGKPYKCNSCGYRKHVEISHIIAVSEFPDSTLIKEINSINNLMALCPNCHWESTNDPEYLPTSPN